MTQENLPKESRKQIHVFLFMGGDNVNETTQTRGNLHK